MNNKTNSAVLNLAENMFGVYLSIINDEASDVKDPDRELESYVGSHDDKGLWGMPLFLDMGNRFKDAGFSEGEVFCNRNDPTYRPQYIKIVIDALEAERCYTIDEALKSARSKQK